MATNTYAMASDSAWQWFIEQIVECESQHEAERLAADLRTQAGCIGARAIGPEGGWRAQAAHMLPDMGAGFAIRCAPRSFFAALRAVAGGEDK